MGLNVTGAQLADGGNTLKLSCMINGSEVFFKTARPQNLQWDGRNPPSQNDAYIMNGECINFYNSMGGNVRPDFMVSHWSNDSPKFTFPQTALRQPQKEPFDVPPDFNAPPGAYNPFKGGPGLDEPRHNWDGNNGGYGYRPPGNCEPLFDRYGRPVQCLPVQPDIACVRDRDLGEKVCGVFQNYGRGNDICVSDTNSLDGVTCGPQVPGGHNGGRRRR